MRGGVDDCDDKLTNLKENYSRLGKEYQDLLTKYEKLVKNNKNK